MSTHADNADNSADAAYCQEGRVHMSTSADSAYCRGGGGVDVPTSADSAFIWSSY